MNRQRHERGGRLRLRIAAAVGIALLAGALLLAMVPADSARITPALSALNGTHRP